MVDILMATYNGSHFIIEQIESIIHQTYKEWQLIIRDDGSTDNTLEIINEYQKMYPKKITIVNDNVGNLGVVKNFKELLHYSTSNYIMFCDQDDIWECTKIEREVAEIIEIENESNTNVPILCFSDLSGIDANNNIIFDSFNRRNKFICDKIQFSKLLFGNVVTGCTVIFNKLVRDELFKMPDDVKMHDHWAVLSCMVNDGVVRYINQSLVMYRQHSHNVIGDNHSDKKEKINRIIHIREYKNRINKTILYFKQLERQIEYLNDRYKDSMCDEYLNTIEILNSIWDYSCFRRICILFKLKCFQFDIYRNILMIMYYGIWGSK